MLVGVLDLPIINMGFCANSCEVSHFTEAAFKDFLKISFVTQFGKKRALKNKFLWR